MASSRKRSRQRATIIAGVIGTLIILTFVISLVAPDLGQRTSEELFPTFTPFGTLAPPTAVVLPTPDPDPALAGALPYVHRSGLFQTFLPAGTDWLVSEADLQNTDSIASVVIQSRERLALIHNYIQPGVEYESLETLSENFLTSQYHSDAWFAYDAWQESGRNVTSDGVAVDFALETDGNDYLGRSTSRLEGDWLYVTRVVVPANNPGLLEALDTYTRTYFTGFEALQGLPPEWPALVDQQLGYVLKHPASWAVIAGGPGRPVTMSATSDSGEHTLRVLSDPSTPVETAEQAHVWLEETVAGATVLGVEPIETGGQPGFQVTYEFLDAAGDAHSGFAVVLNNEDGRLFAANAQLEPPDVDLLDPTSAPADLADLRRALVEGFMVLPAPATEPIPDLEAAP